MPGTWCNSNTRREVDAVQLVSSSNSLYANSACVMKFKADGAGLFNTAQFFIYFESFSITDCSVTLKMYYSSSSTGVPDVTLGCNDKPRIYHSTSRYVTLRLDKQAITGYHFVLTMTATKTSCGYRDFRCFDNTTRINYCFDDDVICDGARNCPDHSDERTNCYGGGGYGGTYRRRRMGTGSVVGSVFSFLFFIGIISLCVFMVRRRRLMRAQATATQMTVIRTTEQDHPNLNFNQPPYPNYPQTGPAPPGYQTVAPPPGAPVYPQYPPQQGPPPQGYAAYPPPGPAGAAPAYPPQYQAAPNQAYPPQPQGGGVAYNAGAQQVKM